MSVREDAVLRVDCCDNRKCDLQRCGIEFSLLICIYMECIFKCLLTPEATSLNELCYP